MAIARARSLFGHRPSAAHTPAEPARVPQTRWDNVGLAVERAMHLFVAAAAEVDGVEHIAAMSSGPVVHFVVSAPARRWDLVVDDIEQRLFPHAKSGNLPTIDYSIISHGEPIEPGYVLVYPG